MELLVHLPLPFDNIMADFDFIFRIGFVTVIFILQLVVLLFHVHVELVLLLAN